LSPDSSRPLILSLSKDVWRLARFRSWFDGLTMSGLVLIQE